MEDYVNFEQAVKLKELGFDYPVRDAYFENEETLCYHPAINFNSEDGLFSQPTLAHAQKWLREVKDTIIVIDFDNWCEKYGCHVYKKIIYNSENIKDSYGSMLVTNESNEDFDSYEQALSAGIDRALELQENE